mgnify:CR=1 FL=1|jgi:ATP synthase protein I|tara:strand:+ start:822 stop:1193 length:372 start_codon:yes stop_codon:yes gene_type:complete
MTTIPKPPVNRVALYQMYLLLPFTGVAFLLDAVIGLSVMVGGVIQVIPHAWFARQAFKYTGARQTHLVVRAMYQGETGKVVLTAALFVIAFSELPNLNFLALMSTFILMIPVQWYLTVRLLEY